MMPRESEKASDIDGFIVIDKPKGPTSHQVDYWVRQILGMEKVGHIGTLDPGVTGVLVMALGKATKLIDVAHEQKKEYVAVMRLYADRSREEIEKVFGEFQGEVYQIPPMRSAVLRALRIRRIHSMNILEIKDRLVLFRVECESGTYIRTLCTDMGYALGCGAQMAELRRTRTGVFDEGSMGTLQDLADSVKLSKEGSPQRLQKLIFSMDYLFRDHPKIIVKKSSLHTIARGSDLFPGGIKAVIGEPGRGARVAVLSDDNELVGTGRMLVNHNEIGDLKVVDFDRILIENPDQKRAQSREKPKKESRARSPVKTGRYISGNRDQQYSKGGKNSSAKFRRRPSGGDRDHRKGPRRR